MCANRNSRATLIGALLLWIVSVDIAWSAGQLVMSPVRLDSMVREYVADGLVEAVYQSTVSAQTGGRVRSLLVDVNDYVVKGEVILELQDTEQRAALARARAGLVEAGAMLDRSRADVGRMREVFRKKVVSQADMDASEAGFTSARARLDAAQAELDRASEQLSYTVVHAPYSGIVLGRHVEVGETVQPGTPLLTGLSLEQLRVVAEVPQNRIVAVREHRQATVMLYDKPVSAARLTFFPYADPATSTFKVRVHLPPGIEGIFPGMIVKTAFVVGDEFRLMVPASAVARRGEVTACYVVDTAGRVWFRQIRVGRRSDNGIEVLAGLDQGEQVALDPIAAGILLRDQRKVTGNDG